MNKPEMPYSKPVIPAPPEPEEGGGKLLPLILVLVVLAGAAYLFTQRGSGSQLCTDMIPYEGQPCPRQDQKLTVKDSVAICECQQ